MTAPPTASSPAFAAAARAAAGHPPSALMVALLIVVIAGTLGLAWDLSARRPGRAAWSRPEPPAGPGDAHPPADPAQERP